MSQEFKVVRRNGVVMAAGPNEDYFQPQVEAGDILSIEPTFPAPEEIFGYVAPQEPANDAN